jgi:hypothetical protein
MARRTITAHYGRLNDGCPVEMSGGKAEIARESIAQRSHGLGGIARPLAGEMQSLPVCKQCLECQGFVGLSFLAFGRWIDALCYITDFLTSSWPLSPSFAMSAL